MKNAISVQLCLALLYSRMQISDIYLLSAVQTTCFPLIVSDSADWMTRPKRHPPAMTPAMALTHPVHSSHRVLIPPSHLSFLSHTHTRKRKVRQPAGWLSSHPLSWVGSPPDTQTHILSYCWYKLLQGTHQRLCLRMQETLLSAHCHPTLCTRPRRSPLRLVIEERKLIVLLHTP